MSDQGMSMNARIKLSAMMFLQFMMIAVWWVPLAAYLDALGIGGVMKSTILSTMAFGCLVSPLVGMVADRHFNGEKVLMVLNVLSGILLIVAARITAPVPLFLILLAVMLCYMPTWGLTSAIAMANSPSEQFPQIRVFGSIGWVFAAVFSVVGLKLMNLEAFDGTALPLYCAAGCSFLGAVIALTLPPTKPPAKGQEASIIDALGLRSFGLMKDKNFAIFIAITFVVSTELEFFYLLTGPFLQSDQIGVDPTNLPAVMTIAQFAEIFVMAFVLSWALKRYGMRKTLAIGVVAWPIRYVIFAFGTPAWLVIISLALHGFCYVFFFVAAFIYVDKVAPPDIRASAQSMIAIVALGFGRFLGSLFAGWIQDTFTTDAGTNWTAVFLVPCALTFVCAVAFLLFFREEEGPAPA